MALRVSLLGIVRKALLELREGGVANPDRAGQKRMRSREH
jgi:hypothetical protein